MKNIIPLIVVALLSGCATQPDLPEYIAKKHSYAYQVAYAGGLVTGINDTEISNSEYSKLAAGAVGYAAPLGGLTSLQSAGLGILSALVAPDSHASRDSIFGWMPLEMASSEEDAQAKMIMQIKSVVADVVDGAELIYEKDGWITYHFYQQKWGCPRWVEGESELSDMCQVKIQVYKPYLGKSSKTATGMVSESWVFSAGHGYYYPRINVIPGTGSDVPVMQLYRVISRNLPDWLYLYLAPSTGHAAQLMNQDKVHYFAIPKR